MKIALFLISLGLAHVSCAMDSTKLSAPYKNALAGAGSDEVTVNLDTGVLNHTVTKDFYGTHFIDFTPPLPKSPMNALQLGKIRIGGNERDVFNWENHLIFEGTGQTFAKIRSFEELINTFRSFETEAIVQVNLMGWRPEMVNNNYQITESATAKSAGDLVRHLNGKLGLKQVDFCLGNEFEQWHETHPSVWKKEDPLTADEYIKRYVDFVLEMRKAQEEVSGNPNDIKIWGPEIANTWYDYQSGNMAKDCEWDWYIPGKLNCHYGPRGEDEKYEFTHFIPYFLSQIAKMEKDRAINPKGYKLLDYFSFHYYPNFRTKGSDINSIVVDSAGKQDIPTILGHTQVLHNRDFVNLVDRSSPKNQKPFFLGRIQEWKDKYYPDAKLAMNEFAVDSIDTTFTYHPIIRPLTVADTLGIMMNHKIEFFNLFCLSSNIANDTPWPLLRNNKPTDMYYLYKMFSRNMLGKMLPVEDSLGDQVNGYATFNQKSGEDGNIHLMLVNKDARPRIVKINLRPKGKEKAKILDYEVPAWSASFLKIPARINNRSMIKIEQFGAKEMKVEIDPHYINQSLNRGRPL